MFMPAVVGVLDLLLVALLWGQEHREWIAFGNSLYNVNYFKLGLSERYMMLVAQGEACYELETITIPALPW
ncbi:unnamed protein product [Sphenostylis stenocarpa]|uniref:Uncharacterized protein n=1 Tax=Sphenostylis stenocarpa TaxID=92480 RepID=A0AA86SC95_9FABA|nr:unnamed protein product [Sphenostylis stenocarpa]